MSMGIPRVIETVTCPLDGYEGVALRMLANPTRLEKEDWWAGNLGDPACPDCAKVNAYDGPLSGPKAYCSACSLARERFGRALVAICGENTDPVLDFSTPERALATLDSGTLPDELVAWLYRAPGKLWLDRIALLEKKLIGSSETGS